MSNYYGPGTPIQTNPHGHASAGDMLNRSNSYQNHTRGADDHRQAQHGINQYGWSVSNQNMSLNNVQGTYSHSSWHDRSHTSAAYNYQRDSHAPPEHTITTSQTYQSRDPYNSQNTQGLNHLAYASGLEPSASPKKNGRNFQTQLQNAYTSSTTAPIIHDRTVSPANVAPRYATNTLQKSVINPHSMQNNDFHSPVNNHSLAHDAAAALAAVARGRYTPSNLHTNHAGTVRTPNSPNSGISQPTIQPPGQRSDSSPKVGPSAQRHGSISSQTRATVSNMKDQHRATVNHSTIQSVQLQSLDTTQQSSQMDDFRPSPTNNTTAKSTPTHHPQSIANLVSSADDTDQVYESVETQSPMPHYIDPTQVFNPYHREHEQKKREAAEAESRKKAEEERLSKEKRNLPEDAVKKASEPSTAANSKSKITKRANTHGEKPDNRGSKQAPADPIVPAPDDEGMASEMQRMMAKMKEFRSTNPALFQKLWNDMKGSASGAVLAATTTEKSVSPQVTRAPSTVTIQEPSTTPARSQIKKGDNNPIPSGVPLNGYKVVVEGNQEGLPDLGRFPAERRIRYSYAKHNNDNQALTQPPTSDSLIVQHPLHKPAISEISAAAAVAPTPNPTVAWPEPRRRAVAIAATHLLKMNPENASIPITAQEICTILERNPAYIDLCAAFEARGLKFQRNAFARELLKRVPELQASVPKTTATPNQGMMVDSSKAQHTTTPLLPATVAELVSTTSAAAPSLYEASQKMTTMLQNASLYPALTVKSEPLKIVPKQSVKVTKVRTSSNNRPEPPPGSKEAAARKRDFAELIDLTEIGDNENYVLPSKQPRLDVPSAPDPFKQLASGVRAGFSTKPPQPLRFDPQPILNSQQSQPPPSATYTGAPYLDSPSLDKLQQQNAQPPGIKNRMVLARRLDKSQALQKSYYDPKTVARDILIASGRHPSERPLNLHLANMLGTLIDLDSDVSTFDWDSIDPGGPPMPSVPVVDIPAAPPRFQLGQRVPHPGGKKADDHKTRAPEEAARKLHPTSPTPSNRPTQDQRSSQPSDHHQRRDDDQVNAPVTKSTPSSRKISIDVPLPSSQKATSNRSSLYTISEPKTKMTDATSTEKKRGRPFGSKNKYPSVAQMRQQAHATVMEAAVQTAPEPILHSYKCKWVKCRIELHNLDTLKRHVFKVHAPTDAETRDAGFICWWKRCRYLEPDKEKNIVAVHTFQNCDEWMNHIQEDHLQPIALEYGDGPQTKHTGKQNPRDFNLSKFLFKPSVRSKTRKFSHIDPQSVELARERYLSDPSGRATTPLVTPDGNPDLLPDAMILTKAYPQGPKNDREKADVTAQSAFMKAHGNKTKDTRKAAEEVVRAMEAHKQKIGPGLDRGGCTLVNEARRSTFMQAPGISRIVDAEY